MMSYFLLIIPLLFICPQIKYVLFSSKLFHCDSSVPFKNMSFFLQIIPLWFICLFSKYVLFSPNYFNAIFMSPSRIFLIFSKLFHCDSYVRIKICRFSPQYSTVIHLYPSKYVFFLQIIQLWFICIHQKYVGFFLIIPLWFFYPHQKYVFFSPKYSTVIVQSTIKICLIFFKLFHIDLSVSIKDMSFFL